MLPIYSPRCSCVQTCPKCLCRGSSVVRTERIKYTCAARPLSPFGSLVANILPRRVYLSRNEVTHLWSLAHERLDTNCSFIWTIVPTKVGRCMFQ